MSEETDLPPKDHFERFVQVQRSGRWNMFDPKARMATHLTPHQYAAVMDNYTSLTEKYPDVVK